MEAQGILPEPADLTPVIDDLVRRAANTRVAESRLRQYARLLAYARLIEQGEKISAEHTRRAVRESIGEFHGMRDGYHQTEKAERAYRLGRKARQSVHGSAYSARMAVLRLHEVLAKHQIDLPDHIRKTFPPAKIQAILETLNHLWRWTYPTDNALASQIARADAEFSATRQAYIWWRYSLPTYPGKWADMHALARTWRLTDASDVSNFRRHVLKICSGVSATIPSPPWATA
jgi:hypothetical protein